tara:strand:- start:501 stop:626 length:126 start_codon:yes stop_codon:yes gene_type:complete
MTVLTTEKLLKIYKTVKVKSKHKEKPKYPPARKHYNTHLFG